MNDLGVVSVTGTSFTLLFASILTKTFCCHVDFLPRPLQPNTTGSPSKPLLPWLIRRVECIRGSLTVNVECAPAFNYARNPHVTSIVDDDSVPLNVGPQKQKKALFESSDLTLDLRFIPEKTSEDVEEPVVHLTTLDLSAKGHKGLAVQAFIHLVEGQAVTFILRNPPGTTNAYAVALPQVTVATPVISQVIHGTNIDMGAKTEHDSAITAISPKGRAYDDPFLTRVRIVLLSESLPRVLTSL